MGVPVIKSLKRKHYDILEDFFCTDKIVEVNYNDETSSILDKVLNSASKIK